jgi:hypothetical protein
MRRIALDFTTLIVSTLFAWVIEQVLPDNPSARVLFIILFIVSTWFPIKFILEKVMIKGNSLYAKGFRNGVVLSGSHGNQFGSVEVDDCETAMVFHGSDGNSVDSFVANDCETAVRMQDSNQNRIGSVRSVASENAQAKNVATNEFSGLSRFRTTWWPRKTK